VADYNNPTDIVTVGTSGDDTFTVTDRGATLTRTVAGKDGYDHLIVDRSFDTSSSIIINQFSGDSYVFGTVYPAGPYDNGVLTFQEFENVKFTGTAGNDSASIKLDQAGTAVTLALDGGAGTDSLTLDVSGFTSALTFLANSPTITSSFGSFTSFENFTISGGAGNDEIRTGDGGDSLSGGGGSNILSAGGGGDVIYTVSTTDWADGGAGFDIWTGNYSTATAALTLDIGDTVKVGGTVVAVNMESLYVGTGSGNDVIHLTTNDQAQIDAGAGIDLLTFVPDTDQVETVLLNGSTDGIWHGGINASGISNVEQMNISGGAMDDDFRVLGVFTPGQLTLNGGAGNDKLTAEFENLSGTTTFIAHDDGTVDSNRGQFSNFEQFSITGGQGADTIQTGAGNDFLSGGGGDDMLVGGGGRDTIDGGDGNDTILSASSDSISRGGAGNDTITSGGDVYGGAGDDVITSTATDTYHALYFGDGGNDTLNGSEAEDVLAGGSGADVIYGNGGNDRLYSATTEGAVYYVENNDRFLVWEEADTGTEHDQLFGGAGDDLLSIGYGDDADGGTGTDTLTIFLAGATSGVTLNTASIISGGTVTFAGGTIKNIEQVGRIYGSNFNDVITVAPLSTGTRVYAGAGNDRLIGGMGSDLLDGGEGSDVIDGGGGGDLMGGGAGNDVFYVRNALDQIVEGDGLGYDTILASVSYTLVDVNGYVERLAASDSNATIAINLTGNAYSHLIQGNNGVNVLTGGTGNDSLFGYAGDDRLDGGAGSDTLTGGIGNDTYVVDNGGDVVVENAGEGTDTVESSISYTLGTNLENLTLTGANAIDGTGNAGANTIRGNAAANTLNGAGGTDSLYGGAGDDTYIVDNAGVQIVENAGEGTDTIRSSLSYTLGTNLENLVLTGTGNINGYGNAGQNVIAGNAGSNTLDGGGGGDTLQGGAGNDVYYVRNAADVIVENAGEGTADTVLASVSYTLTAAAQVERLSASDSNLTIALNLTGNAFSHLIQGNAGVNVLTGGSGDDKLYGYAGDDRLDGGQGTDTLYGGIGNDTYVVDSLSDVIVENPGEGTDTVEASITYSLAALANVETLTLTGTNAIDGTGNALDNVIRGNSAANTLNGGGGTDMLYGGAGDDTYVIGDAHAKVVELVGEGNDTVQASVNYSLAGMSNIETLMLTGSAVSATGNAEHNTLIGTSGSNTLDGGGGGDTLQGGAGNDVYYVRNAADVIIENAGEGTADTVLATLSYTLTANAQVERLAASDSNATTAINLTGNAWAHLIQGNNGANVLTGGSGADTLMGYGGNDTLFGGGGADKFVFAHGTGQDTIGDFVAGTDKIDLTAIGFASYQDVINATHDVGGNAVIDLGNGDQVTLTGVTTAQLHSGDFIGVGNSAAAPQMQLFAAVDSWHGGADTTSALHG